MARLGWIAVLVAQGCMPVLSSGRTDTGDYEWSCGENPWPRTPPEEELTGEFGGFVGQQLPDGVMIDQYGNEVCPWQFYGKVVIVDFGAGWCAACRNLAAHTQETAVHYAEDGVVFMTVLNGGDEGETPTVETAASWAEDYEIVDAPVLADATSWNEPLVATDGLPVVLVTDRNLVVQYRLGGPTEAQIVEKLEDVLAQ